jgi:hypothetical protein
MCKRTEGWLALILCVALALNLSLQALAKELAQPVHALKLEQTHCTLGNVEVLVTNQAIKVSIKKSQVYLVAHAPTWKVVWYRNDPKLAFECPFADWCKTGTKLAPIGTFGQRKFKKEGVAKISGQSILKLRSDENKKTLVFWVVDDSTKPLEACNVLVGLFRVPLVQGIPYKFKLTYLNPDKPNNNPVSWMRTGRLFEKEEGTRLDTTKISSVTVPSTEFDYPRNYKLVKQEQEVWLSAGAAEAVDDLLNMPTLEYKKQN